MIDASTMNSIELDLMDIGFNTGLESTKISSTLEMLSRTKEEWLLLFDNADNPDIDLSSYFPSCNHEIGRAHV